MKTIKIIGMVSLAALLGSCGQKSAQASQDVAKEEIVAKTLDGQAYTVETLLGAVDSTLIGDTILIKGVVTHTCKHSGRRCFIMGADQKTTVRVEAKGEIGGFNKELIGTAINVKGIVREHRLTKEMILQSETDLALKTQGGGETEVSAESCESEMANIVRMKEWMEQNNKDYYSNYYLDGLTFEVVE